MKKVTILSGIPGCGKTTWAQSMSSRDVICSADDYFMVNGEYRFDPSRIAIAHSECFLKFLLCIGDENVEHVIVDNTNIHTWEWQNYYRTARMLGCEVGFVFWLAYSVNDIKKCAERNSHGVPRDIIARMALDHEHHVVDGPGVQFLRIAAEPEAVTA